ncbi:MAG: F420-0--gamma-glutamyl ligase [Synergistaceae bacterium]|nr:F420-0--gamma-glutamyl ligase [Synergistaceae bacterium]
MRYVGAVSRGIRLPIVTKCENLVKVISDNIIAASKSERDPFVIRDRDVIGVTESLLARAQGNFVSIDDISEDIRNKVPDGDVSIVFPIMSRNRFLIPLQGIVNGVKGRVHLFLSYPSDEVGNEIIDPMNFYLNEKKLKNETFDEKEYYEVFGEYKHSFTGVNYVDLYKSINPEKVSIYFTNNPLSALDYSNTVIVASIHARKLHKEILENAGANVISLDEICSTPVRAGAGYNKMYGLLGSNYMNDTSVKLLPQDSDVFVRELQDDIKKRTGKKVEVLVYGDGAFKDPVCGIWELADPVVSPGFTDGLLGVPKEIKFKYVADNAKDIDPSVAVREAIESKADLKKFSQYALGTTPRRITDLLGSLCDLTSGSGDKGTPIVYIQGYFDSYLDD